MTTEQLTPAQKRSRAAVIGKYLEALEAKSKPRGRRTKEYLQGRLAEISTQLSNGDVKPLERVQLYQEQYDISHDLVQFAEVERMDDLEAEFIKWAAGYSADKGISYATWRDVGVEASVLKRAGIER